MTGFDDEGGFYAEEYIWERNGERGWGHPPMLHGSTSEGYSPIEQAANVAAALLQTATEGIGQYPLESERVGAGRDGDLAEALAQLTGLEQAALRAGLMLLRGNGYRLVKAWWTRDDATGWDQGVEEVWPGQRDQT